MYPYITVFGLRVGTYGLWMLVGLFAAFILLVRLFAAARSAGNARWC